MIQILSITGGMLLVTAFYFYFRSVSKNTSTPNPATWLIWLVIFIMNTVTYFMVARGSFWQTMITIVASLGILAIFFYSLFRGKFAKIGSIEVLCLTSAIIVGLVWKTANDPVLANFLLQFIYIISFIPTISGLIRGTIKERILPWALAFSAYIPTIIIILINWDTSSWVGLVHPVVNGLIGNGTIILLLLSSRTASSAARIE